MDARLFGGRRIIEARRGGVKQGSPGRDMLSLLLLHMAGGEDTRGVPAAAASTAPAVVRQKETRLTGGRVVCTLIFDRPLSSEELTRFYRQPANGRPIPLDFLIEGRNARFECEPAEEAKWRLAFEIYFVKAFRVESPRSGAERPSRATGIRTRAGLRKLHLG